MWRARRGRTVPIGCANPIGAAVLAVADRQNAWRINWMADVLTHVTPLMQREPGGQDTMAGMSDTTPASSSSGQKSYRLDRRFVLTSIGVQLIGAGVAAMLAFLVSGWIGLVALALLLNAARVLALPPKIARTEFDGARLGGPLSAKPVHVRWADVDDVSIGGGQLVFSRGDGSSVVFSLVHLGGRANDFVQDVYARLNTANGYSRFDPTA